MLAVDFNVTERQHKRTVIRYRYAVYRGGYRNFALLYGRILRQINFQIRIPETEPDPEPVLRERNALYIASSPLEGNFNPFYVTSAADKNVIGMTQLKMLSIDSNGAITAGAYEPTVVKAFS